MDFELSETERMLAETARRIVARDVEPVLAAHPPDRALPKAVMLDLYRAIVPLGCTGARIAEAEGGTGLTHVMLGLINESLPPVLGFSLLGHESTTKRIHMNGTHEQKARFLPDLLSGKRLAGTAASEPNVGSDPRGIETTALRDGDHYVLNGTKLWITNGPILDTALVVASLGRDASGKNLITRFVVDREESPFESREIPTVGLQQGPLGELHFRDCRVPKANMLGDPGDAHRSLTFTWLANRPNIGLFGVHLAQKALDASINYARQREQFGQPIARFQLVQEMLAEMSTLIDASRLLCYRALALLDRGVWCHRESSVAKAYASEAAVRVTNLAIQLHGSYGLTREAPLEGWARDARMLTLPDGTTQIHQLIIGRELVGMRAFA
ncbi:MAG TPA: acyl-CoA dehydrogenase family protein [Candidatus Methylomirabilis sp.]|nr:acyl-CoA dehydrogenase family protein [Candidatus Methylomirabilis sp.]